MIRIELCQTTLFQRLKGEIVTALDREESETLAELADSELSRSVPRQKIIKLSENLKMGLHYGRAKVLRRLEELEQFPAEGREYAFTHLKKNTIFVLAKL